MTHQTKPRRLRDLPGWDEAFQEAMRAKQLHKSSGIRTSYVGPVAIRSAGNFVGPDTLKHVTVAFLLCIAIGIESQRHDDRRKRVKEKEDTENGNVISLAKAKAWKDMGGMDGLAKHWGYDIRDTATWAPKKAPHFIEKSCELVDEYTDEGAAE